MTGKVEGDVLPTSHQVQPRSKAARFALVCEHHSHTTATPASPGRLTALSLNAEPVFEALVGVGAGDHLRVRASHVHVFSTNDDVAAITLESGH